MSKNYNHEIGYESLLSDFKLYRKQTPKGVTLVKEGNNIYLQFKTPNKSRSKYKCNCSFTIDGMIDAVRKAHKVKEKLETLTSETEFWNWYDQEIKNQSQLANDQLTFGEAITLVENDFWSRPSRTKRKRDKNNPSDQSSWKETYGRFYSHLPINHLLNFEDILKAINKQNKGGKSYKYSLSAMKKLCRLNKQLTLVEILDDIKTEQTEYNKLQTISIEDFLNWRAKILSSFNVSDKRFNLNSRKAWLWVFSIQVVYGLRIHEVFAIKNLFEPYKTEDSANIPALNNPENTNNLIVITGLTQINTTTKTGYRIARPQIPPKYPDMIEQFEIKQPLLPDNKTVSNNPNTIRKFYAKQARRRLVDWNAPSTQTHALRHLANINGMQAGIPLEVRAQSMGHTPAMNDSVYKKRQSTQTTIDLLLNSNSNAIDFVTALGEAKKLVKRYEDSKQPISELLAVIYQKNSQEISDLL